jgi:HEAT repeat protein
VTLGDRRISDLIWALDGDPTGAEEAQAELEEYGPEILPPLLEAAPVFGRFGQLCAIELLERIGDPRAGSVLIPMLRSEHDTVREWSAGALAALGVEEAVPELRRAYEEVKARGTPLDWSEPKRLRDALTQLGARDEVVLPRVAALSCSDLVFDRCWPVEHLATVVAELADAEQLVLYFQLWKRGRESKSLLGQLLPSRPERDSYTWKEAPGWELDWSLPWPELIASARDAALAAARQVETADNTVATGSNPFPLTPRR